MVCASAARLPSIANGKTQEPAGPLEPARSTEGQLARSEVRGGRVVHYGNQPVNLLGWLAVLDAEWCSTEPAAIARYNQRLSHREGVTVTPASGYGCVLSGGCGWS